MATFPLVTAPTPNQPLWRVQRQVLGAPAASITITGIAASYKTLQLELSVAKDASQSGINLQLNAGSGGVDYMYDTATSSTISNAGAIASPSMPFATAAFAVAANRNGLWTATILQNPPFEAIVMITGGFFRNVSAVPVIWDAWGQWNMLGLPVSSITINSEIGNFAANTLFALTGDDH